MTAAPETVENDRRTLAAAPLDSDDWDDATWAAWFRCAARAHGERHDGDTKPTIVVICGSTRFMTEMTEAAIRETVAGRIVVKPECNMKQLHPLWADPQVAEELKCTLDQLHRAKIRLADEVLVVGDYIGESTRAEIRYARALGKPVRFTHPVVDPERSA